MLSSNNPNQNRLLAALPAAEFERLAPHLQVVPMRLGDVLGESGDPIRHAYFPTTAIVSLHYVMESGSSAEVAGVGNEGMVGMSLFTGGGTTVHRAVVQTGGYGYQLAPELLMAEFDRSGPTMRLLLRYTQAVMTQMAQTGVCNRYHSVLQQLSRWLLLTLDRMPSLDLVMTQELIASMLGVRREGITEAAGKLKDLGALSCRRGHITVLNRSLLNDHVCECYQVVKSEFGRLLSDVRRRQPIVAANQSCR
jgi:CRP-like cAMP-binding protein